MLLAMDVSICCREAAAQPPPRHGRPKNCNGHWRAGRPKALSHDAVCIEVRTANGPGHPMGGRTTERMGVPADSLLNARINRLRGALELRTDGAGRTWGTKGPGPARGGWPGYRCRDRADPVPGATMFGGMHFRGVGGRSSRPEGSLAAPVASPGQAIAPMDIIQRRFGGRAKARHVSYAFCADRWDR